MSNMFRLIITKVDEQLFNDEAVLVTVPGADGELTVLANHQPFISTLREGEIRVKKEKEGEYQTFPITSGLLEVSNNQATILV